MAGLLTFLARFLGLFCSGTGDFWKKDDYLANTITSTTIKCAYLGLSLFATLLRNLLYQFVDDE